MEEIYMIIIICCVAGTKYMLVDCGGGTVDITVHEMESHGRLKELYKATGGPYGSVGSYTRFHDYTRFKKKTLLYI